MLTLIVTKLYLGSLGSKKFFPREMLDFGAHNS
jgi:hypothetical protein